MLLSIARYWQLRYFLCICAFFWISTLSSCKNANQNSVSPYENNLGIKPSTLAQIDTIHYTTIGWINPSQNFGVIKYGDSVLIRFRFKNTGIHPLFLSAARPSCGCTVPRFSDEAIMPDEENEITVNFNSIGQADTIHKTILVTSNTSNGVKHMLTIEGRVDKTETGISDK